MSSSSLSRGKQQRPSAADRQSRRDDLEARPSKSPRRRGRFGRWFALLAIALAAFVWFLPMLAARGPLLNWAVGRATPELNGTVAIGSASLGWFSPVRVSNVEVADPEKNLVFELPAAAGDTSLARLAWNPKRLGTFTLERPTIHVVLRPDGSNIEDLIAGYLTGPSGEPVAVRVEVKDATIHVKDHGASEPWTIEKFNLSLATSDKAGGPIELTASGTLPDRGQAGEFAVKLVMDQQNRLGIKTTGLELARLNGLLARFVSGTQLAGRLDAEAECGWSNESTATDESNKAAGPAATVSADLTVKNFAATASVLGDDRLALESLTVKCRAGRDQGKFHVDQAELTTDVGQVSMAGRIELTGGDARQLLESLLKQTFELTAQVDLARAARLLPNTLRIDQQTQVTAGRLTANLSNQPGQQGAVCRGRFEIDQLAAVHRGQELRWEQPITISLAARQAKTGPTVDRLECRSSFLSLDAAGDSRKITAFAQVDLDRLVRQIRGFIDLGGLQLAGNGSLNLEWQRNEQNVFRADGDLRIHNLHVSLPMRQPWLEDRVTAIFTATGATDFGKNHRLDTARIEVKTNAEQYMVRLTEPMAQPTADGPWPVAVEARGDLAHWIARLKAWDYVSDWDARGGYQLTANLMASQSAVEAKDATLAMGKFQFSGAGLHVAEPGARLALAGRYDHAERRATVGRAKLESGTLAVDASEVVAAFAENQPFEVAGNVNYQANLATLQNWFATPGMQPTWRAGGTLQGAGQVKQTGKTTNGQLDATVTNLVLQGQSGEPFTDPKTQLSVRGTYDATSNQLKLDQARVATAAVGLQATGQIDSLGDDAMTLNLAGEVGYDWQRLMPLLRPYVGDGARVAGRGQRPLSMRGPIDAARVEANGGVDWSGAYAYGFQVGPGELVARLTSGLVECDPIDVAVSEGRLTARPRLRIAPEPLELELEAGPLVEQVRINPDMCAQGLQYIAPVLAGVAAAEGRFSIHLTQCRIRFDDPARSELVGRFTVHSVEIGPGSLVRELAVVLNRATAAKLKKEAVIPFRLTNGRVHHTGLELEFPEITIRTEGSVGLDQTMELTAEMPIPPKWLAGQRLLNTALANQTLRVPIGGTLTKPKIDQRRLDEYNRQLFGKAVENIMQDELNRQLDRLFTPKR
ncbi:MAG: DUF748 domain-containing protein [Pirellulaceae bacterium]|nr:DUF748 domain-containing protein [Pirellulaceae bacterium]